MLATFRLTRQYFPKPCSASGMMSAVCRGAMRRFIGTGESVELCRVTSLFSLWARNSVPTALLEHIAWKKSADIASSARLLMTFCALHSRLVV